MEQGGRRFIGFGSGGVDEVLIKKAPAIAVRLESYLVRVNFIFRIPDKK